MAEHDDFAMTSGVLPGDLGQPRCFPASSRHLNHPIDHGYQQGRTKARPKRVIHRVNLTRSAADSALELAGWMLNMPAWSPVHREPTERVSEQ